MTDYPNKEHEVADKAARRRALHSLQEIETSVGILRRRLEDERAEPDGDDTQRIASLVRDLTQHFTALGVLRDAREWHEADQAESASAYSLADMRDEAVPYSGPRSCLYCSGRARWDVAGFLSCSDSTHLGRAYKDLNARREQEDAAEEGAAAELRQSDAS